jgi:hypothetical protein
MLPHHVETLERTTKHFTREPGVLALLLGGSLAHGFAVAGSDIDVMIVVSDEEHERRLREAATCFFSRELCTYPDGYVDGKYISTGFMRRVRDRGSEPARFAFQDARILFSRDESLPALLMEVARYPTAEKATRLWRFQAQFEAWFWYCGEALKRENLPLLRTAVAKLTLFGGRIVLAHNEQLYPYHKWFLRVLEQVQDKPPALLSLIERLARAPDRATIDAFGEAIRGFRSWEISHATWPAQFMADSELNWLSLPPPVDDI